MVGRSSIELSVEGRESIGGDRGEDGARLVAIFRRRRELEDGWVLRHHIKVSKVPEDSSITILELDIVTSLNVSPVGKTVNAIPVVATEKAHIMIQKGRKIRRKGDYVREMVMESE